MFSTYAHTFQVAAALEQAEDELFIHSALHDIGVVKATFAYVLTEYGRHCYAKRNGEWQPAPVLSEATSPAPWHWVLEAAGRQTDLVQTGRETEAAAQSYLM